MKTELVKIDFNKPLNIQLKGAAKIIREGGLVAFPTETVYGLGGDGLNKNSSKAIYAAKGRPSDNPLIIHIAEPTDAENYAYTCEMYYTLARAFMPGPLTVIMKKKDIVPFETTGGLDSVAIRCPINSVAHALIKEAGTPIAAPSANISGKPSSTNAIHVLDDFNERIDMVIDGGQSEFGLESTIVKIGDGYITLLRPGSITVDMLKEVISDVRIDKTILEKPSENFRPLAPGMKYRHYAPSAKVSLIIDDKKDDFDNRVIKFLNEKASQNKEIGIICFDEYIDKIDNGLKISIGKKSSEKDHAKYLFSSLRELDKNEIKEAYAVVSSVSGEGLAFYNRMLKASGYNIIEV